MNLFPNLVHNAATDYVWTRLCNQPPPHTFYLDAEPLQSSISWRRAWNDANSEGERSLSLRDYSCIIIICPWQQHFGVGIIPWSPLARGLLTRPLVGATTKRGEVDKWACSTIFIFMTQRRLVTSAGSANMLSSTLIRTLSTGKLAVSVSTIIFELLFMSRMQFGRTCQEERCEHGPDRTRVVNAERWWVIHGSNARSWNAHHEMQVSLLRSLAQPHSPTWRTSLVGVCHFAVFTHNEYGFFFFKAQCRSPWQRQKWNT